LLEGLVGFKYSFDIFLFHEFHNVIGGPLDIRTREESNGRIGGSEGSWFRFVG
jgi:hypothetical protein